MNRYILPRTIINLSLKVAMLLLMIGCNFSPETSVSLAPTETSLPASSTPTPDTHLLTTPSPTVTSLPATNIPSPTQTATSAIPTDTPSQTPMPIADVYNYAEVGSIKGRGEEIASIALSPDGSLIAYSNYDDNFIYLVDTVTSTETMTLEGHTDIVISLKFSPDGQLLASAGESDDVTVRIWDINTGEQLAVFETPRIGTLAFNADGTTVAGSTVGDPVQIILWDIETYSEKTVLNSVFSRFSFSPNGELLAAGSRDELVHIFNTGTGHEEKLFSGHEGWISATAFNPIKELLATGSDDKTIRLWEIETGKTQAVLKGHDSKIDLVAFSPDGDALASLGSGINIVREGNQVSFTIGSEDKLIRFWNVETGQQISTIEADGTISEVSFNTDWSRIATATGDGFIQLWSTDPSEQVFLTPSATRLTPTPLTGTPTPEPEPTDTPTLEPTPIAEPCTSDLALVEITNFLYSSGNSFFHPTLTLNMVGPEEFAINVFGTESICIEPGKYTITASAQGYETDIDTQSFGSSRCSCLTYSTGTMASLCNCSSDINDYTRPEKEEK